LPVPHCPLTGGALGAEQDAVEPPPLPAQLQLNVPSVAVLSVTLCDPAAHALPPVGTLAVATPFPVPQVPLTTGTLGAEHDWLLPPPLPRQFQLKVPSAALLSVTVCEPVAHAVVPLGTALVPTPSPEPQVPLMGVVFGAEQEAFDPPYAPAQVQSKVPSLAVPSTTL
jgi:hypothetical protein